MSCSLSCPRWWLWARPPPSARPSRKYLLLHLLFLNSHGGPFSRAAREMKWGPLLPHRPSMDVCGGKTADGLFRRDPEKEKKKKKMRDEVRTEEITEKRNYLSFLLLFLTSCSYCTRKFQQRRILFGPKNPFNFLKIIQQNVSLSNVTL